MVEDEEALDLLHARVVLVDAVQFALDELDDLRVTVQRADVLGQAVLAREVDDLLGVERDQRDRVGAAVGVHDGLGDPARALEVVLQVRGREVLAARGDHDVLLAARDRQVAVVVERAEVAGVQPAVLAHGAERGRVAGTVVAPEDVRAADEDLAVVGDLDLGVRERAADGAEPVIGDGRGGGDGRGLRHPVALEHGRAAGVEELEDLLRDRRRAGGRLHEPAAEDVADVDEQLGVGLVEGGLQRLGDLLAGLAASAGPSGRAGSRRRSSPGRCWR